MLIGTDESGTGNGQGGEDLLLDEDVALDGGDLQLKRKRLLHSMKGLLYLLSSLTVGLGIDGEGPVTEGSLLIGIGIGDSFQQFLEPFSGGGLDRQGLAVSRRDYCILLLNLLLIHDEFLLALVGAFDRFSGFRHSGQEIHSREVAIEVLGELLLPSVPAGSQDELGLHVQGLVQRPVVQYLGILLISSEGLSIDHQLDVVDSVEQDRVGVPLVVTDFRRAPSPFGCLEFGGGSGFSSQDQFQFTVSDVDGEVMSVHGALVRFAENVLFVVLVILASPRVFH